MFLPERFGGGGVGLREVSTVVRELGAACSSTMIVTMHYAATAALVAGEIEPVLREIGAGRHLSTLVCSEEVFRSHFWTPVSSATAVDGQVRLDARKRWVTSAGKADSYVWSSHPLAAEGPMTLWRVAAGADGAGLDLALSLVLPVCVGRAVDRRGAEAVLLSCP